MNDLRDYYLQNLGIGEIWKSRDLTVVDADSPISAEHDQRIQIEPLPVFALKPANALVHSSGQSQSYSRLDELGTAISTCQQCDLCQRFGKSHLSDHRGSVDILVISEFAAPTEYDIREKLILNLVNALPQTERPQQPLIALRSSAIKANAPIYPDKGDGAVNMATCISFLKREIELIRPRLILILGSDIADALLDSPIKSGMDNWRKVLHSYRDIPLVVTYGETELIQNPALKAFVWDDICQLSNIIFMKNSG